MMEKTFSLFCLTFILISLSEQVVQQPYSVKKYPEQWCQPPDPPALPDCTRYYAAVKKCFPSRTKAEACEHIKIILNPSEAKNENRRQCLIAANQLGRHEPTWMKWYRRPPKPGGCCRIRNCKYFLRDDCRADKFNLKKNHYIPDSQCMQQCPNKRDEC